MLPRVAHLFVTTAEMAAALDLSAGPTQPIYLANGRKRKAPVSGRAIPYTYEPSFFDLVCGAIAPGQPQMEVARKHGNIVLYRFPTAVAARLAELTPDRFEFTRATIDEITHQLMQYDQVKRHFQQRGVSTAVIILRGYSLETSSEKFLYYWCRPSNER
jgi:hypothetical protein